MKTIVKSYLESWVPRFQMWFQDISDFKLETGQIHSP